MKIKFILNILPFFNIPHYNGKVFEDSSPQKYILQLAFEKTHGLKIEYHPYTCKSASFELLAEIR